MRIILCASGEELRVPAYDPAAPKRAVNLSINGDLAQKARLAGVNLSAVAQEAIERAFARVAAERFRAEINASVAQHDAYLAEYGSLAEALRDSSEMADGKGRR
jgi:antitoxin CcdA